MPTYNERSSVISLIEDIFASYSFSCIVVVDDSSPDGTGETVEELKRQRFSENLFVLHRKERGRGTAGIAGFKLALRKKVPFVVEMDADQSHRPQDIARLLDGLKHYELVIGSRLVAGAKDNRPLFRRLITRVSNAYLSRVLKMPNWDITSGFRAYRREALETIVAQKPISKGPPIVVETLYIAFKEGFYIGQVPITFENRKQGSSKLNAFILLQSLYLPYVFKRRYGR